MSDKQNHLNGLTVENDKFGHGAIITESDTGIERAKYYMENMEYTGTYSDIREIYTKRFIGETRDFIIEYNAEHHLAFIHNTLSIGFKHLKSMLKRLKPIHTSDVYKIHSQEYLIMKQSCRKTYKQLD